MSWTHRRTVSLNRPLMDAYQHQMIYLLKAGRIKSLSYFAAQPVATFTQTTENDSGNDFRPDAQRIQRCRC